MPSEQTAVEPCGTMMVSRGGEFEVMQLAKLSTPDRITAAKDSFFSTSILYLHAGFRERTKSQQRPWTKDAGRRGAPQFCPTPDTGGGSILA